MYPKGCDNKPVVDSKELGTTVNSAVLKCGKEAGICNVSGEMLKAGGESMIRGLHAVLSAVW